MNNGVTNCFAVRRAVEINEKESDEIALDGQESMLFFFLASGMKEASAVAKRRAQWWGGGPPYLQKTRRRKKGKSVQEASKVTAFGQ